MVFLFTAVPPFLCVDQALQQNKRQIWFKIAY